MFPWSTILSLSVLKTSKRVWQIVPIYIKKMIIFLIFIIILEHAPHPALFISIFMKSKVE